MTKSRNILRPKHKWTASQDDLMRQFYPDLRAEDLANALGASVSAIYNRAGFLGLEKSDAFKRGPLSSRLRRGDQVGAKTQFKKGFTPWNKGVPNSTGMSLTRFQPGQKPKNTRTVGEYRVDKTGTLQRKISTAKGNNNLRWRSVHELLWIEANGGLPSHHIVVFKKGMKTNVLEEITIDRLECISIAENMRRNSRFNLSPEINQIISLRASLSRQLNARSKEDAEHPGPA